MDNKLAAILARRKQQEDEDGDMGYYMTEETQRSVKNTATEIEAEQEKAKKEKKEKEEKERLQKEKAAAEITAEKEKAERENEKNEKKEGLRKAAAEKAKTIEDSCISNGAELERPSRTTRSTDGQSNFMDVLVGTMLRDRDEGCGSSDTHYHAPAAAVAPKAQQRQPQIAEKENSLLSSLEPQDSLPKKLIERSPFRRAGYSGSIPLKANLEIPATKANLESPATHQSQTNSIAKESFEHASVITPLAHATSTTDVNLEIQATHRSQTNSIEEIAGNSTLMKTIPPNPKTVPLKSNLEIQAGAANALMGTNFGVAESKIAPVAKIDRPTSGKTPYRLPSTVKNLTDPDNRVLGISRTVAAERKGREVDADNCGKRETYTLENVLAAGNSALRYTNPWKGYDARAIQSTNPDAFGCAQVSRRGRSSKRILL